MPTTVAVVLAGGTGTRLYPASTAEDPKQFRALASDEPLLTATVERARRVADEVVVLTRARYADRVRALAPGVDVLAEPEPKDTGPALVYGAAHLREQYDDAVLLTLPSDHHVAGDYAPTFERACTVARETGGLVTLGVRPTRAATGYGYINPGEDQDGVRRVETFVEKPDPGAAARYREHGYLWNAGIFAWTPDALLDAARDGELGPLVEAAADDSDGPDEADLDEVGTDLDRAFAEVPSVSVDYAVMEEAEDVFVVPAEFEWDDLGSWDALERVREPDEDGNVRLGETLALDAADSVLAAGEGMHVAAVDVDDLVVAAYDGRVVVVPKRRAERVRDVVDALR
jgi:mannose-1-phosphate guanylyltransferase